MSINGWPCHAPHLMTGLLLSSVARGTKASDGFTFTEQI